MVKLTKEMIEDIAVESTLLGLYSIVLVISLSRFIFTLSKRASSTERKVTNDRYAKPFFFLFIVLISLGRVLFCILSIVAILRPKKLDRTVEGFCKILEIVPGLLFINSFFLLLLSWSRKYHKIRYYFRSRITENVCQLYNEEKKTPTHHNNNAQIFVKKEITYDEQTGILDTTILGDANHSSSTDDVDSVYSDQSSVSNSINNRENTSLLRKSQEEKTGLSRGDHTALFVVRVYFVIAQILLLSLAFLAIAASVLYTMDTFDETKYIAYTILMDIIFSVTTVVAFSIWSLFTTYSTLLLALIRQMTSDHVIQFVRQLNSKQTIIAEDKIERKERDVILRTTLLVAFISIMSTIVLLVKMLMFIYQLCFWLTRGKATWTRWLTMSRYSSYIALGYYICLEIIPLTLLLLLTFRSSKK